MIQFFLVFQLEAASNKLIDYGLLGVIVIGLAYFIYKMSEKINKDQEVWRNEAIKSREAYIELSTQQHLTNQKLIDIRQRDVDQQKEHHFHIKKKLEDLPQSVRLELRNELNQRENKTSAG